MHWNVDGERSEEGEGEWKEEREFHNNNQKINAMGIGGTRNRRKCGAARGGQGRDYKTNK